MFSHTTGADCFAEEPRPGQWPLDWSQVLANAFARYLQAPRGPGAIQSRWAAFRAYTSPLLHSLLLNHSGSRVLNRQKPRRNQQSRGLGYVHRFLIFTRETASLTNCRFGYLRLESLGASHQSKTDRLRQSVTVSTTIVYVICTSAVRTRQQINFPSESRGFYLFEICTPFETSLKAEYFSNGMQ